MRHAGSSRLGLVSAVFTLSDVASVGASSAGTNRSAHTLAPCKFPNDLRGLSIAPEGTASLRFLTIKRLARLRHQEGTPALCMSL